MEDTSSSPSATAPQLRFGKIDDFVGRVTAAIEASCRYLFSQRQEDAYWCGELEADTTLESDYILLHTLLGTVDQTRFDKAARYILQHQNEDGGWAIYEGGPAEVLGVELSGEGRVLVDPGAAAGTEAQ